MKYEAKITFQLYFEFISIYTMIGNCYETTIFPSKFKVGGHVLDFLIKKYLKIRGKDHLLSFIEALQNAGRPSTVKFPPELIEQGFELFLSGINNTLTIQSNLQWVWPYWVEQQIDPNSKGFIPTGVNVLTTNLSHRNWTSLGNPNSKKEVMIDPVGMLTLNPFGWSVFPYIKNSGEFYFPPKISQYTSQELFLNHLPRVITKYAIDSQLLWESDTFVMMCQGEELVHYVHTLKNTSPIPVNLTFGLSLRPYNTAAISPINKVKFHNRLWRVNGKPALLLLTPPSLIKMSNRTSGDPLFSESPFGQEIERVSKSGVVGAIAEYPIHLKPGESWKCITLGTLGKYTSQPNSKFTDIQEGKIKKSTEEFVDYWNLRSTFGLEISTPDETINTGFKALKNHIHVFDDGDYFTPGTYFYHQSWIRDSSFFLQAYHKLGWQKSAREKLPWLLNTQTRDGFFKSQNGEWDSNGEVLFSIVEYARYFSEFQIVEENIKPLVAGIKWIKNRIDRPMSKKGRAFGLLPAGFSAEHFGPNDHYYWDNFWSLGGILNLIQFSNENNFKNPDWILEFSENYQDMIRSSVAISFERSKGIGLPSSPYRLLDSASIGNLIALDPLEIVSLDTDWVNPTLNYLWEEHVRNGLLFQKIIHTGLNPYLSVQLAKVFLMKQDLRWHTILQSILKYRTNTWTWPEAIHPQTFGGCMGDGDHGWVTAEVLCFMRDLLVKEYQHNIHLGLGFIPEWFEKPGKISCKNAPTRYGYIEFELMNTEMEISFSYRFQSHNLNKKTEIYLHLPAKVKQTSTSLESTQNPLGFTFKLSSPQANIQFKKISNTKPLVHHLA